MKLYGHPVSTTTRPVMLLAAEAKLPIEFITVDLMKGEHHGEAFTKLNPLRMVPVLQDGDFVLTESSAILKYLADKADSPLYPKDPKKRARVNERMDWFNSNFYKDWGYNLIYPQLFPHHKRATDEAHTGALAWGKERSAAHLKALDESILGGHPYVCGSELTIADLFGAQLVCVGETIGCKVAGYKNVDAWIKRIKALPSWAKVNEAADGWAASMRDKQFVTL